MFKFLVLVLALCIALVSADCTLYLSSSDDKVVTNVGSTKSGCYEVDPGMPVAAINADHTNVNFKFYSSAECTGKVTYAGTTNGTVITVTEFSAGSVRVTCARQRRR
ncbi:hypothetical protein NQZ79_g3506 [Umbelopsis isabellina]|nr:hypothetical protein NQZ79_g3506 [Umbelopsis isabellina]